MHLAPYFNETRMNEITFAKIERYIAGKRAGVIYDKGREVGKGEPLSARSINMTLTLLGAILKRAVKRKLIEHNPARDRDLRVRERAPARSYLDGAGQIVALLDAAGELDRRAAKDRRHVERRAMLRDAGLRRPANRRAVCSALARRRPRRRMAGGRRGQDRRWPA